MNSCADAAEGSSRQDELFQARLALAVCRDHEAAAVAEVASLKEQLKLLKSSERDTESAIKQAVKTATERESARAEKAEAKLVEAAQLFENEQIRAKAAMNAPMAASLARLASTRTATQMGLAHLE